jgi:hypothetical protein
VPRRRDSGVSSVARAFRRPRACGRRSRRTQSRSRSSSREPPRRPPPRRDRAGGSSTRHVAPRVGFF